ncbi:hypothetical protein Mal64_07110 [Pseudobythopirellula maris]|uniref:LarA-like N-terminal domain-containing protein n=1 Tax=Pseudobythopirellula maris TaxID=2527991 RepID=A0A5C5ZTC5_9BACT|nr:lactate racemase domain-containing protein [Pseudobythopirellula maris]TWT90325.1 hypothetical protein Mal64_07110 [Pseudobythopirellula maris]
MPLTIHAREGAEVASEVAQWRDPTNPQPAAPQDAERVRAALRDPVGLPPLEQCLLPDDHVTVALAEGTPAAAGCVRAVVEALVEVGVAAERITVLAGNETLRQVAAEGLVETPAVSVVAHDPADAEGLCFLGLGRGDRELRISKQLFEADFVLVLGPSRPAGAGGAYAGLYPEFADLATLRRRRRLANIERAGDAQRRAENNEAGRLVGASFAVRVTPDGAGGVAETFAGEIDRVDTLAAEAHRRRWSCDSTPEPATLVIARVGGDRDAQTWTNVARALDAAERLVDEEGAIAICSALDETLGESLGRLVDSDDLDRVAAEMRNDNGPDAWAAWRLLCAVQRGPVYLMSGLDGELVESLGVTPIANLTELGRLAGGRPSCVVLDGAQHVSFDAAIDGTAVAAEEPFV